MRRHAAVMPPISLAVVLASAMSADNPRLPPARDGGTESEEDRPGDDVAETLNVNLPLKTLGGRQFWADVVFHGGWRIQRNVFSGHHRLLDPNDVRQAWGTRGQCQARLAQLIRERRFPDMRGQAVVLVHGLLRSSKSMRPLAQTIERETGWATFSVGYPSTRVPIEQSAASLNEVLDSLAGIERVHFVAHSMGGLVVRQALAARPEPRLGRIVFIGTPHHGAELADLLGGNAVYRMVLGPSGQQLKRSAADWLAALPVPDCEFAVIAGGRGDGIGYSRLVPGDDDGTVSVPSTRLAGAADMQLFSLRHRELLSAPDVAQATSRFLQTGRLRAKERCMPAAAGDGDEAQDSSR